MKRLGNFQFMKLETLDHVSLVETLRLANVFSEDDRSVGVGGSSKLTAGFVESFVINDHVALVTFSVPSSV